MEDGPQLMSMGLRRRKMEKQQEAGFNYEDVTNPSASAGVATDEIHHNEGEYTPADAATSAEMAMADSPSLSVVDSFVYRYERWVPYVIAAVALFTRFYRLPYPAGVNFDESHFIRFTNQYTARTYFFDIHPPLGKLSLWLMGQLVGLNLPDPSHRPFMSLPTDCNYEHISEDYVPGCKYVYLRSVASIHSAATVLMLYFIVRNWGAGVWGGILASGLLLFDLLNNIQGRLVLLDVQLSFWTMACLLGAQYWWKRLNEHFEAAEDARAIEEGLLPTTATATKGSDGSDPSIESAVPKRAPRLMSALERNLWCVGMGVLCANACSVKMTGGVTPLLVAVESFFALWFLKRGAPFIDLLKILVVSFFVYAFYFAVHFALLTRHGDGDEEFMSDQFQSTLLENRLYDPTAKWEGFWYTFFSLNKRMIVHNANILAPHPWMSSWWEWVLNLRGVSYYGRDHPFTYTAAVYLIGNHAIHLGVIAGSVAFLACVAAYLRFKPHYNQATLGSVKAFLLQGSFCLLAYWLNLAPYLGVARSTFIYHYMPALLYGELLLARVVEHVAGRFTPSAVKVVLLIVGVVWLHYSPWIYGFPLTNDAHHRRRWNPRWD